MEDSYTIPHTKQFTLRSQTKENYQVFISVPTSEPPEDGYPVLYVLDGNAFFGTVVEAVNVQSRKPDKTGVCPIVVVGIGYQTDQPFSDQRFYDYTLTEHNQFMANRPDGSPWPKQGGARLFLEFIEQELKPTIQERCFINLKRQTLFGHSLGGLFTLYALLSMSSTFSYFAAGSPSIHWNQTLLADYQQRFQGRGERLLITVGEREREHPSGMVDHAVALAERLQDKIGIKSFFKQFAGEGHASVVLPLVNDMLRLASS
ncbi:alpha/beta hydrolase [Amphibacillus jilinensis]|uniref:alpha/beta hydrolase n=1 Tax=Amphibacillus jilinensis TaxID=1216008 RepID=UPI000309B45E|nr:alpha/beta hydrolase-fold protein [Amphibacillus jilinensis]